MGSYLLVPMSDYVVVKITEKKVSNKYEKYTGIENSKQMLYLRLKKALYGCMQCAVKWYNTFKSYLEGMGFKMNHYDLCVVNK